MNALDRLLQLQKQGLNEQGIINMLQQEGFPMKDINDSLNQANIKNAISQEPEMTENSYQETMQPANNNYQTPQNDIAGDYSQPAAYPEQSYAQYPDNSAQQGYGGGYYSGTETMTDIAEQVVLKKTHELQKKIDELTQTRNQFQRELDNLKENVRKIESGLDTIQRAIIGKIGEFGESTKVVQRDLENIHGTMSKMMNPLIDNYNELKKLNSRK